MSEIDNFQHPFWKFSFLVRRRVTSARWRRFLQVPFGLFERPLRRLVRLRSLIPLVCRGAKGLLGRGERVGSGVERGARRLNLKLGLGPAFLVFFRAPLLF